MSVASSAILSNFFEEKWTQNHPQYLLGMSRALFPTAFLEIAVCEFETKSKVCINNIATEAKNNFNPTRDQFRF